MSHSGQASGGVGICTVLFLIFLVLKLIGVIGWSWWWVFSPFWIPIVLVVGIVVLAGMGAVLWATLKSVDNAFFKEK